MKHLKLYESFEKEPQIGDYVICEDSLVNARGKRGVHDENDFIDFITNNVGQYIAENNGEYSFSYQFRYVIKYENIPKNIVGYFTNGRFEDVRGMKREEILYFSPNKEDLDLIINAKKYNL